MATTTATTSAPTTTARAFPLKYFVLAIAFTWVLWWLAAFEARGLVSSFPIPTQGLGVLGPLVAAVILTAQESGRAGLRSLLSQWRVPIEGAITNTSRSPCARTLHTSIRDYTNVPSEYLEPYWTLPSVQG